MNLKAAPKGCSLTHRGSKNRLARPLIAWYRKHQRPLPWRATRDPYRIWVSEVMLQQTQVKTVIPYYHRWLVRFPDIDSLAKAPIAEVLKLWEGLGYYRRARHLHEASKVILSRHGGRFPDRLEEIASLPGIGRYTAGAIASIAFGQPEPVLDGNVARVLTRLFGISDPIDTGKGQKRLWRLAEALVPAVDPGDYNQALMELGATLCLPESPSCLICPFSNACLAHRRGEEERFPKKANRQVLKKVRAVSALVRSNGKVLLAKRPDHGLWAGLWELPTFRLSGRQDAVRVLEQNLARLGFEIRVNGKKMDVKRSYTIHREDLEIYECELAATRPRRKDSSRALARNLPEKREKALKDPSLLFDLRWVAGRDLGRYPFPATFAKIIETCGLL